jgi:branched-chain amino acid transport system substrate-binding protein
MNDANNDKHSGKETMKTSGWRITAAALLALGAFTSAAMAEEVKVGIVASITGPFSIWGREYKEGIDMFMDKVGGKAGNNTMSIIYRDVGGVNPPRSRQLAQELVLRDKVAVLGGHELTPNVLAVTDVINQAKIPFVIFNTGTAAVSDKSPFFVRPTFTNWTTFYTVARYAGMSGMKKCATIVADYAPGQDAAVAAAEGLEREGGEVVADIKVPLDATDFSSYLQRVKDASPQCTIGFMPQGPMSVAFLKAYIDRGLQKDGIKFYGQSETDETDLPSIGDGAIGMITSMPYQPSLDNAENKTFLAAFHQKYGADHIPPTNINIAAYDGMQVIQKMAEVAGEPIDGQKEVDAIKGMKWLSPRGPVSIDPTTRELIQNVYIREVVRENGVLYNKAIYTFENQKEPWHETQKK